MRLQAFIYFLIICSLNILLIRPAPIDLSFSQSRAYVSPTNSTTIGDKIEKSKQSIKNIILGMKKNDRINIIVYNPTADLLVENGSLENKDEIFAKIDQVVADDGTNLFSGLELGIEVAKGKNK